MKKLLSILISLFLVGCSEETSKISKNISWGIGKDKDDNHQPLDCVKANETYASYDAIFVGPVEKKIYLTFDNGYENGNTEEILDILLKYQIHAVFFITGYYAANEDAIVRRMIDEGHTIGNHSFSHKSFQNQSREGIKNDIMKLHRLMIEKYNYVMDVLRPPLGEFSIDSLQVSKDLNYQNVFWSFAYYDYNVKKQPSETDALDKLEKGLHPGAIYLLHSISDTNKKVLEEFINYVYNEGYKICDYDLNQS